MKTIEELLKCLVRPEVLEFGLVTDRLPSINIAGRFEPVDDYAPTSADVLRMLAAVGGSAHVAALSDAPAQWTAQVDGIGVIAIAAIKRDDVVHARFTLAKKRDAGRTAPPVPRSLPPTKAPSLAAPSSSTKLRASMPVSKPSVPKYNEDDDEPTIQTVLPAPRRPPSSAKVPISVDLIEILPPSVDESHPFTIGDLDGEIDDMATGPLHMPSQPVSIVAPSEARPSVDPTATLEAFLASAIVVGASDLHLVGGRPVLLRVAGELESRAESVGEEHVLRLVKEIVPGRLRGALERDGVCDFALEHPEYGRFRVNASRQRTGYKLSLRVIPKEVPTLGALGLATALSGVTAFEDGLVLITGPMGHGKSSTLAALVDRLNHETTRHIMTIEEPIEHLHPRGRALLSQREVGQHSPTAARALETALLADVDTLVIGELRDALHARHALRASEGGRLVLATVPAPTAMSAVTSFIDLLPPAEHAWARASLASSLRWVVAQRLTRGADGLLHADVEIWSWSRELDALTPDASNERDV